MNPKTLIFAHRGILGVENNSQIPATSMKDAGLGEDDTPQIKIPASDITISQEALDILNSLKKSTPEEDGYIYVGHDKQLNTVIIHWAGESGASVCVIPELHRLEVTSDIAAFTAAVNVVPVVEPNPLFVAYVNSKLEYAKSIAEAANEALASLGLEEHDDEDLTFVPDSSLVDVDDKEIEEELATAADNFSVIRDHNMTEEDVRIPA